MREKRKPESTCFHAISCLLASQILATLQPPLYAVWKTLTVTLTTAMPNMTGRPGCRTMEMNGGSSASYLARTPCVPFFVLCLIRVEAEGLLAFQGRAGITSIARWNPRPVVFGVDNLYPLNYQARKRNPNPNF